MWAALAVGAATAVTAAVAALVLLAYSRHLELRSDTLAARWVGTAATAAALTHLEASEAETSDVRGRQSWLDSHPLPQHRYETAVGSPTFEPARRNSPSRPASLPPTPPSG